MKAENLFEAIGQLDDDLIDIPARRKASRKILSFPVIGSIAASLLITVLGIAAAVFLTRPIKSADPMSTVITSNMSRGETLSAEEFETAEAGAPETAPEAYEPVIEDEFSSTVSVFLAECDLTLPDSETSIHIDALTENDLLFTYRGLQFSLMSNPLPWHLFFETAPGTFEEIFPETAGYDMPRGTYHLVIDDEEQFFTLD